MGSTSVITKLNTGASINLKGAATTTTSLSVAYVDTTGSADATTITFAGPTASTAPVGTSQAITSLTLADSNGVGVGTLNIVDNNVGFAYAGAGDNITTLVDNGVTALNFSGAGQFAIGGTAGATPANFQNLATSMTIGNTGTNGVGLLMAMTDSILGNLTFTGSGKTTLKLVDHVAGTLNIVNSGTGSVTIVDDAATVAANVNLTGAMTATITDANLTSLALTDGQAVTLTAAATTGITVSGAADNSRVELTLGAAIATKTNSVTLGNGNNKVTDATVSGAVSITVGTGYNLIDTHLGSNLSTYSANISLGAHTSTATAFDKLVVSATGTQALGYSTSITGVAAKDVIVFADAGQSVLHTTLAAEQTAITAASTLAGALTLAFADLGTAHAVMAFAYGGDTYVIENAGADTTFLAGTDSVVKLVGTHTIAAVTDGAAATISLLS